MHRVVARLLGAVIALFTPILVFADKYGVDESIRESSGNLELRDVVVGVIIIFGLIWIWKKITG